MLDRVVALELITSTLERQIRPYMKEHGLNQDEIFSLYIKDLMERSSQIRSYSETSLEAKAVAIIGFISDLEVCFSTILLYTYFCKDTYLHEFTTVIGLTLW